MLRMSTQKSIAILGIVAVIALGASLGSLPYALVSAQQTNMQQVRPLLTQPVVLVFQ